MSYCYLLWRARRSDGCGRRRLVVTDATIEIPNGVVIGWLSASAVGKRVLEKCFDVISAQIRLGGVNRWQTVLNADADCWLRDEYAVFCITMFHNRLLWRQFQFCFRFNGLQLNWDIDRQLSQSNHSIQARISCFYGNYGTATAPFSPIPS